MPQLKGGAVGGGRTKNWVAAQFRSRFIHATLAQLRGPGTEVSAGFIPGDLRISDPWRLVTSL